MSDIPKKLAALHAISHKRRAAPLVKTEGNTIFHTWESAREMLAWIAEAPGYMAHGCFDGTSHHWSGGVGPEESAKRALCGWPEGMKDLKEALVDGDKAVLGQEAEQGTSYDVSGAYVDVAAYLSGQPECMVDFVTEEHPVKRLTISLDGFITCNVDAATIKARGKAVVAAAMALQARGVAVDVTYRMRYQIPSTVWSEGKGKTHDFNVSLWRSGQVTDLGTLAGMLISPGFLRQLFFEAQVQASGNTDSSIAGGFQNRWSDVRHMPGTVGVESVLIGEEGERSDWSDPATLAKFVAQCFKAAG